MNSAESSGRGFPCEAEGDLYNKLSRSSLKSKVNASLLAFPNFLFAALLVGASLLALSQIGYPFRMIYDKES